MMDNNIKRTIILDNYENLISLVLYFQYNINKLTFQYFREKFRIKCVIS